MTFPEEEKKSHFAVVLFCLARLRTRGKTPVTAIKFNLGAFSLRISLEKFIIFSKFTGFRKGVGRETTRKDFVLIIKFN